MSRRTETPADFLEDLLGLNGLRVLVLADDRRIAKPLVAGFAQAGAEVQTSSQAAQETDVLVVAPPPQPAGSALSAGASDRSSAVAAQVTAVLATCLDAGRAMVARGAGRIVIVLHADGLGARPGHFARAVAGGALVQLARTLGAEWIGQGVNVNAVAHGDLGTPTAPLPPDRVPAARQTDPQDLVGPVLLLSSPAAAMVVGHTVVVDGGHASI